jgi:hypothetical protein
LDVQGEPVLAKKEDSTYEPSLPVIGVIAIGKVADFLEALGEGVRSCRFLRRQEFIAVAISERGVSRTIGFG